MGNVFNIGKSALRAANYGISVTGHNISNAKTPGYNRQVILQSNVSGQRFSFGFVGNGVQLDDVRRVYDEFLGKQFVDTQSEASRLGTYYDQIQKINSKLADDTAGVSPALQDFFSAVQEIASTPTSAATREAMLSEAQVLAGRYNNLAAQLNEQRDLINSQMINSVELINTYAHDIAKLNEQISRAQVSESDPAPNDLLDQRDYLITQMAQEIGVRTVENGNQLDVYVGNGQPVVINNQSFPMYAKYSDEDPQRIEIGYVDKNIDPPEIEIPERLLSGGNLKGYMQYRNNELDPVMNELGLLAINLASDFNAQHKIGQDLNGDPGEDLFGFQTRTTAGTALNDPDYRTISAEANITDVKALKASNYLIAFDGANYTVTRQSDGTRFDVPDLADPANPVVIDGVTFSARDMRAGDSLVIKPLYDAASSLNVLISDPNKIAAALPVRTASGDENLGSGKISLGEGLNTLLAGSLSYDEAAGTFTTSAAVWYVPPGGGAAQQFKAGEEGVPYEEGGTYDFGGMRFTLTASPDAANVLTLVPNAPATSGTLTFNDQGMFTTDANVWYTPPGGGEPQWFAANSTNVPYVEGASYNFGGMSFTITDSPAAGDTFSIEPNAGGTGDNRNMLALAALQDARTMLNGTTSYQGAYSQMVNRIGSKTRELEVMSNSQDNLLNEIYEEQQSQSGVNLDDEAVNLMWYQQCYSAASQMILTANRMFDTVLGIFQ
ncbi:MAG: flagellar hook-associated protein FlgK [Oxalobacter formigenes]|nr:flagellar hook-associated protein FlgK [Oxalobacter formigenes]